MAFFYRMAHSANLPDLWWISKKKMDYNSNSFFHFPIQVERNPGWDHWGNDPFRCTIFMFYCRSRSEWKYRRVVSGIVSHHQITHGKKTCHATSNRESRVRCLRLTTTDSQKKQLHSSPWFKHPYSYLELSSWEDRLRKVIPNIRIIPVMYYDSYSAWRVFSRRCHHEVLCRTRHFFCGVRHSVGLSYVRRCRCILPQKSPWHHLISEVPISQNLKTAHRLSTSICKEVGPTDAAQRRSRNMANIGIGYIERIRWLIKRYRGLKSFFAASL